jgi:hypothetical protein
LLRDDVVHRSIRFRYGGRVKPLPGMGWGVEVDTAKLDDLTAEHPIRIEL